MIRQAFGSRQVGLAALILIAAPLLASQSAIEPPAKLTAVVLSVSDQSLNVLTRERDAVTFVVSRDTKVIGKGLATPLPQAGRRWRLADALQQGDAVKVLYREAGGRKFALRIERLNTER